MIFNLLFAAVSSLYFSIEFGIDLKDKQDYLFFEGQNQTAHLSRINNTITLYLSQQENFSVYETNVNGYFFIFTWQGFLVNGQEMQQDRSNGEIVNIHFEKFTFLSPIIRSFDKDVDIEPVYRVESSFNYWYIVLIIFTLGVLFESKSHGMRLLKRLLDRDVLSASISQIDEHSNQNIRITDV